MTTKTEFQALMRIAEATNFGDKFSPLAAETANVLHRIAKPKLPASGLACLIKWQALQLNGEWSPTMLSEVCEFVKPAIVLFDAETSVYL